MLLVAGSALVRLGFTAEPSVRTAALKLSGRFRFLSLVGNYNLRAEAAEQGLP
jgi:hypothetical protein